MINTTSVRPRKIADKVADLIFKNPQASTPAHFTGDLGKFTGSYNGRGRGQEMDVKIGKNDSTLLLTLGKEKPQTLRYIKENSWTEGSTNYHLFKKQEDRITELRIDKVYGYLVLKRE